MLMDILGNKTTVRILHALRRKPKRFGELQKELGLNPTQVDRALKTLRKDLWIIPRVVPSEKGRMIVEYEIGKRGLAFLEAFKAFTDKVTRRKGQFGETAARELESLTR